MAQEPRDNDLDDLLTANDGVDTNRNWAEKWRYDQEGAVDIFNSDTYRGTSAQSEPEVSALDAMFAKLKPKFLLDYHTYGPLILYPEGWQVETPSTDTPATAALAGLDDDHPAIADYDPDVAGELYTTNGDVTGHVYKRYGTLGYTVELAGGSGPGVGGTVDGPNSFNPGGFVFQDSEAAVEDQFQRNLPFALDLARSAKNPGRPVSHLGNVAPDFEPSAFKVSYGDPQTVEVNANRDLGPVEVFWRVGNGVVHRAPTTEYKGGERYDPPGVYYHKMRGTVTGFTAGDQVTVWFGAGSRTSSPFTFTAEKSKAGDVLVMAAEDYSGNTNIFGEGPRPGPEYASYYTQALQDLNIPADVYDVDAHNRTAPDPLGVLSHYKTVIWYTANDLYVREPTQPGGTGNSKLMDDEVIAVRDYLNDGGTVLVTGQQALQGAWLQLLYNPLGAPPNPFCKSNNSQGQGNVDDPVGQTTNCIIVSDDFIQYYLGAWIERHRRHGRRRRDAAVQGHRRRVRHHGVHAQRPRLGRQPGDRPVVRDDVEHPAGERVPAVQGGRGDRLRPAAGVRPAGGHAVRLRGVQRRGLSAAAPHGRPDRRHHGEREVPDLLRRRAGLRLRDRRGPHGRPGRLDDAAGEERAHVGLRRRVVRHRLEHDPPVPESLPDQPDVGGRLHQRRHPARPGSGTEPPATRAASRTGRSTCPPTRASRSRSRSRTCRTSRCRVSACSSTGCRSSRTAWSPSPTGSRPVSPRSWPARSRPGPRTTAAWVARGAVGFAEGPGIATEDTLLWGFGLEGISTRAERSAALRDALTYLQRPRPATPPVSGPPPATYSTSVDGTDRRQRAGDTVADPRAGGAVRRVHPGRHADVLRVDGRERDLDRR